MKTTIILALLLTSFTSNANDVRGVVKPDGAVSYFSVNPIEISKMTMGEIWSVLAK